MTLWKLRAKNRRLAVPQRRRSWLYAVRASSRHVFALSKWCCVQHRTGWIWYPYLSLVAKEHTWKVVESINNDREYWNRLYWNHFGRLAFARWVSLVNQHRKLTTETIVEMMLCAANTYPTGVLSSQMFRIQTGTLTNLDLIVLVVDDKTVWWRQMAKMEEFTVKKSNGCRLACNLIQWQAAREIFVLHALFWFQSREF